MSATDNIPSLRSTRLWKKRVEHFQAVFRRALELLRVDDSVVKGESEPSLSRRLFFHILVARRELDSKGRYGHPDRESENLPDPDSDKIEPHEKKKPDYQWKFDDTSVPDARFAMRSYTIECKRLGFPTNSGWKLNENYVRYGIHRFKDTAWKYGRGVSEGMMIGFVQNMELLDILEEVNSEVTDLDLSGLTLGENGWTPQGLSELTNTMLRSFPVQKFRLTHLWIDLR